METFGWIALAFCYVVLLCLWVQESVTQRCWRRKRGEWVASVALVLFAPVTCAAILLLLAAGVWEVNER